MQYRTVPFPGDALLRIDELGFPQFGDPSLETFIAHFPADLSIGRKNLPDLLSGIITHQIQDAFQLFIQPLLRLDMEIIYFTDCFGDVQVL